MARHWENINVWQGMNIAEMHFAEVTEVMCIISELPFIKSFISLNSRVTVATVQHFSFVVIVTKISAELKKNVITLMCLSIGTPNNNKFSICPKWKIDYFQVSQNSGRVQPHCNLFEYWDT